eukprot:5634784-Prymnesium_polylepis.1
MIAAVPRVVATWVGHPRLAPLSRLAPILVSPPSSSRHYHKIQHYERHRHYRHRLLGRFDTCTVIGAQPYTFRTLEDDRPDALRTLADARPDEIRAQPEATFPAQADGRPYCSNPKLDHSNHAKACYPAEHRFQGCTVLHIHPDKVPKPSSTEYTQLSLHARDCGERPHESHSCRSSS